MKRIESVDGDIFMIDRIRINGDYVIYLKTSNGEYYTIITSEFASHVIEAMLEEVNDPRTK